MTSSGPDLPEPPHAQEDSMLSRKFGREVTNYFSGSPLNRLSFLRTDHTFLSTALSHRTSTYLLFNELKPLVHSPSRLAYRTFNDVKPLIGENPFAKTEEQMIEEFDSSISTPQIVFLGIDERKESEWVDGARTDNGGDGEVLRYKEYSGAPVWAVDVTPRGSYEAEANKLVENVEAEGLKFLEGRMVLSLPASEAAIYAQARSLLDWNARNPFCGGCGQPSLSVNAGGKRTCPAVDHARLKASPPLPLHRGSCATRGRISNLSFPRTDPTVIMAVVSADNNALLLGRQARWPPHWYSTLAGFCEPAESIEEAVRREVWEEAGVKMSRVVVHSSQPWPYPANLMIGAVGQAVKGAEVDLGNDPELEDARFWSFGDVREALRTGTSGLGEPAGPEYKEGGLRLPPPTAIAHQLIKAVVEDGFLGADPKI